MGMVKKAVELAEMNGWFLTRQFENEANADIHSRTTAREILRDFEGQRLDYWVTGFGTGGTLKGVARVLAKERPETKIVVCEPADAPMLTNGAAQERRARRHAGEGQRLLEAAPDAGLEPGLRAQADRRRGRHGGDPQGADDHRPRGDAMQQAARAEGGHLRRHHRRRDVRRARCRSARKRPGARAVLCMLPDTGERYLSTPLFADIPADMTEEELQIMRSTPSCQVKAAG